MTAVAWMTIWEQHVTALFRYWRQDGWHDGEKGRELSEKTAPGTTKPEKRRYFAAPDIAPPDCTVYFDAASDTVSPGCQAGMCCNFSVWPPTVQKLLNGGSKYAVFLLICLLHFLPFSLDTFNNPPADMTALELWILAAGLAMDGFALSVSGGIFLKRLQWRIVLKNAFLFGFFQVLMPAIGWAISSWFNRVIDDFDHWIAIILLAVIGSRMIYDNFKSPSRKNRVIDFSSTRVVLALAAATSIDSLAIGMSLSFLGASTIASLVWPVVIFGLVSFLFSVAGYLGGLSFGGFRKFQPELLGGIILIGIGMKICIQHLLANL